MWPAIKCDKEVWIIGATGGLGRALAEQYLERGWRVVGMARHAPKESVGFDKFLPVDLTCSPTIETAIRSLFADRRHPDFVIVCASALVQGPFFDLDEAGMRAEFETNVFGFVRVCQAIAKAKPGRHPLRIVAVGSMLGYVGCPSLETYSASKAALFSFARTIRRQLRPLGVGIQIISPPHMGNGADLRGTPAKTLAWSARRFAVAAEAGRHEFLIGAGNRLLAFIARLSPRVAGSLMNPIGDDALARGARLRRNLPAVALE